MDEGRNVDAIDLLRAANALAPSPELEKTLVRARHLAFEELEGEVGVAQWPPSYPDLTPDVAGLPEVDSSELTTEALGSALVNHGALIVRNLVPEGAVAPLVEGIDRAFDAYDEWFESGDREYTTEWFSDFKPEGAFHGQMVPKGWVREGGGVYTADSPRMVYQVTEAFEAANLRDVLTGYMGERPALSVKKNTLRRVPTDMKAADWHQDGAFLGEGIRSVNVWLPLTRCGGDAPTAGLDLVPARMDRVLETGTEGAWFDWSVGPGVVERVSQDAKVIRPEFAAGDALLFDDLFLHRTGVAESMEFERYAVESWFFAPSVYPDKQIPLVF